MNILYDKKHKGSSVDMSSGLFSLSLLSSIPVDCRSFNILGILLATHRAYKKETAKK